MKQIVLICFLVFLDVKSISSTYIFNFNKIDDIENFDSFTEKLTNEEKGKDKDLTRKIKNEIIKNYQNLKENNIKSVDLQCPFEINIYDNTKKYISEITEKGNLIFSDFKEITEDGVKNIKHKNIIIINSKKNNTTISVKIFKKIPENKKINKDGNLEDDIKVS